LFPMTSFDTVVAARGGSFEKMCINMRWCRVGPSKAGITGRLSPTPMGALLQVYRCGEPFDGGRRAAGVFLTRPNGFYIGLARGTTEFPDQANYFPDEPI
jgi:hypothetical protein